MEFWIDDCGHYFEVVRCHPDDNIALTWYRVILDEKTIGTYPSKTAAAYALADIILDFGM